MQVLGIPVWAALLMVAGGVAIAVQAPINTALGRGIGSGMVAGAISFGVGFVALLILSLLSGQGAAFARVTNIAPWLLLGGLLGAYYVWAIIATLPRLGVLTAISAVVLGQLVAAMVIDRLGAFGLPVHPISPTRILAALLVGAGLVLSRF